MTEIKDQLDRIEKTVLQILKAFQENRSPISDKWFTEPQEMKIFNLSKRKMKDIRRKNVIRVSSATGRNFLNYRADVENYIYDHSAVRRHRKSSK